MQRFYRIMKFPLVWLEFQAEFKKKYMNPEISSTTRSVNPSKM
ncbi:hypothetical protein A33Q_3439 [Indibacter alkaliphilus LW1]|uniref:Uncharacterized protein n=1 Tax=Indibacter alkaliphilus (strain CCUG 57479 / KCTC 22604 / LW1) TaxID=1189612 RepID=S2D8I3_INDAL|nr:hypothetical protein A33Q_3439 [Indibacter alkaliphilus LW1]